MRFVICACCESVEGLVVIGTDKLSLQRDMRRADKAKQECKSSASLAAFACVHTVCLGHIVMWLRHMVSQIRAECMRNILTNSSRKK